MPVQIAIEKEHSSRRILFGYYAAFTLLLISFLFTFYTNSKLNSHAKGVEQTNITVRLLQGLFAEVRNAESAFQGFLIIQDNDFLKPYHGSRFVVDSIMSELYSLIGAGHLQRSRLDTISGLLVERYDAFDAGLRSFYNFEASDSIVKNIRKGNEITGLLREQITALIMTEKTLLRERSVKLNMYSKSVLPVNLFTFALAILLAFYALITFQREKEKAVVANRARIEKENQLKQKVEELGKANEELVRLRRMEKFTATGRMARIIAHEVRNPLSNIQLAIHQLKDELITNDSNAAFLADIINRSCEKINQLVTELLNATRIQEMQFSPASVNTLLDESLSAAADRVQLQHIKVIRDYAPGTGQINADKEKLKIAFLNIIVNAIEAMTTDEGVLMLKTESKNGKCVVTISDNGAGIDNESLSQLFEPYFSKKPGGSGLGLANTQAIILTHKGNIEVESQPGKGTTFIISLDWADDKF